MSKIYWNDIKQKRTFCSNVNNFIHNDITSSDSIEFIKILYPVHIILHELFNKDVVSIIIPYTHAVITIQYKFSNPIPYNYSKMSDHVSYYNQCGIIITIIDSHNMLFDTYQFTKPLIYEFKLRDNNLFITYDILNIILDSNIYIKSSSSDIILHFDMLEIYRHYLWTYYNRSWLRDLWIVDKSIITTNNHIYTYSFTKSKHKTCNIIIKN